MNPKNNKSRVTELTQDLDELASRFRNRFQSSDGDTGKDAGDTSDGDTGTAFLSSLSRTEDLIHDLDHLGRKYGAQGYTPADGDGDTGKDGLIKIRSNLGGLFKDIDLLSDRYRERFASTLEGGDTGKGDGLDSDTGKGDGLDGDTGKDAGVILGSGLDSLFSDLDSLAGRYRNHFDTLDGDGNDGDTGKDAALSLATRSVGGLINDLDNLAEKHKTRLFNGDNGDTGKDGDPDISRPGNDRINWMHVGMGFVAGLILGAFIF